MAKRYIHDIEVEYDDESETIKSYLNHIEEHLSHSEVEAFLESAQHSDSGKIHLTDKYDNKLTLVYKGDNSCLIRKRGN